MAEAFVAGMTHDVAVVESSAFGFGDEPCSYGGTARHAG